MNRDEIVQLAEILAGLWPNAPRYQANHLRGFYLILKDIDIDVVEAAIAAIASEGGAFPPVAGQIYKKAQDLVDPVPDWGGAWQEAIAWVRSHGWPNPPTQDSFSHPAVFVAVQRIGYEELCQSNTADAGVWQGHFRRIFENAVNDHSLAPGRAMLASRDMENPFPLERGPQDDAA